MRAAISIPEKLLKKVNRLVRSTGRSRSELVSATLVEYVARHRPTEVTEAMDRVCAEVGDRPAAIVAAAAHRVLERTEC